MVPIMTDQTQASRICSSCGQEKPIMAFLELSGDLGRTYGHICADCRQAGLGEKSSIEAEPGDKSGGTTRAQLDHKFRMQTEEERVAQIKHESELKEQERAKKEAEAKEKTAKEEHLEETEKKHREEQQPLDTKKEKTVTVDKTAVEKQESTAFQDRQKVLQTFAGEKSWADRVQNIDHAEVEQGVNVEEARKTSADVSLSDLGQQTPTVSRSAGSIFNTFFRGWLGNSAAINTALRAQGQAMGKQAGETVTPTPTPTQASPSFLAGQKPPETPSPQVAQAGDVVEYVKSNLRQGKA